MKKSNTSPWKASTLPPRRRVSVSYTHLDVYKRQVEQRAVVGFYFLKVKKADKIYSRMAEQYVKSFKNQEHFYKWVEEFKNVRNSVTDEHRS